MTDKNNKPPTPEEASNTPLDQDATRIVTDAIPQPTPADQTLVASTLPPEHSVSPREASPENPAPENAVPQNDTPTLTALDTTLDTGAATGRSTEGPTVLQTDTQNLTPPMSTIRELRAGLVIRDRFVLQECIGRGGMGTVYKALDLRKQEMQDQAPFVAIKFLNEELRDRSDALIALQREAKKSQTLAHPNIITVYDFDREGDRVYLSMEYLEGKTLDRLIRDGFYNRKDIDKILVIIDRIARGLAYAHQRGFVHADLKPSNVFLTDDGTVKLLDLGIAQAVRHPQAEKACDYTHFDPHSLGAITPRYASVEMLAGEVPIPADDMYALGCIAYALFTGRHPFINDDKRAVNAQEAQQLGLTVEPISFLPKSLMQPIQKCLNFERAGRFNNAGELIDALKPPAKLNRRLLGLIAVLILVASVSWWVTLEQSTVTVTLADLPGNMTHIQQTIRLGDERFSAQDIDQAYKLYAQAWEDATELTPITPRDRLNLKVLVDRRVDKIATQLMDEVNKTETQLNKQAEDTDGKQKKAALYRLIQLQLSLEFLEKAPIGTRQANISQSLKHIANKLAQNAP